MTQSRPTYRFADHAVTSTSNEFGNYILKKGAGEIRKPSWNRTLTTIRIIPSWDFDNQRWSPFRISQEVNQFGDWIRRYTAVRGFGERGITMLLNDPMVNRQYNVKSNPCVILRDAILNSITARQCEPDWPALLNGGAGKRAALSKHAEVYLVRAVIFKINNKDMATPERSPLGLANGDPCYFMELPITAGEKLVTMLEERNETSDSDVDPDNYNSYYKYGDIVSLEHGAYVTIFQEGADLQQGNANVVQAQPRQLTVSTGPRGNYANKKESFSTYDVAIDKTWNGYGAPLNTPDFERILKAKQKSWEQSLQFFSHQEQAFLIQDGFPASAILYAWRDHPEWIKEETRSRAVGRVSVVTDVRPQQPQESPMAPAKATTYAANAAEVGGWGAKQADDVKDDVVPSVLPAAATVTTTKPADKAEAAKVALDAARKRAKSN